MNIQSLSICVPAPRCINNCRFCVSRMREDRYENRLDLNADDRDLAISDYVKRLEYARDNGCNTIMLTGQVEPQQNKSFLDTFARINQSLKSPFKNIEIQTTGVGLNPDYLRFLRRTVGVTTISLSVSSLVNDEDNNGVIGTVNQSIELEYLCLQIKAYGFNLRLSLNVTDYLMDSCTPNYAEIFKRCGELGADQVTFRKMYCSGENTVQDRWIEAHTVEPSSEEWFAGLNKYIVENGTYLDTLEYGNDRYSLNEMSVVVDEDCMSKGSDKAALKYLILRPNCKLYSKWDDKGSLIF